MKALLRFQGVLLLRLLARPFGWTLVLCLGALFCLPLTNNMLFAQLVFCIAPPFLLAGTCAGMVITLGAMDTVRWSLPVRPVHVLGAHLLFWMAICSVPAIGLVLIAPESAVPFSVALVLFAAALAAVAPVYQRLAHIRDASDIVLAVLLAPLVCWLGVGGLILAPTFGGGARGMAYLVVLFCIALAASAWTFVFDQALPAAASVTDSTDVTSVAATPDQSRTRTPATSVIRSAWPPPFTGVLMVVLGFAYQLLLGPDGFGAVWIPIVFVGLASIGLSTWRWLIATPIDRGRAFRLLFLPVVLVAFGMTTTRLLVLECSSERTAFFEGDATDVWRTPSLLTLNDLLRKDSTDRTPGPPEVAIMASRVREDLRVRFGLHVPDERVAASIRHLWPDGLASRWDELRHTATIAAMDRVGSDLHDEILAAVRMRAAVNALAALLFSLLLFRVQLIGFRRSQIWAPLLLLSVSALPFLPVLFPKSAIGMQVALVRDTVYAGFQDSPVPVTALLFLAAATAAVFLWRNGARAFRRLEVTDLPPRLNAWGMPTGGN